MGIFSKTKIKRIPADLLKIPSLKLRSGIVKTRPLTNILLGILFSLLAIWFLGRDRLNDPASLICLNILTIGLVFIMGFYLFYLESNLFSSFIKMFSFSLLSLATFISFNLFQELNWVFYSLPVVLLTMIIAVGYSRPLAIINLFFQLFLVWVWEHPAFSVFMLHIPSAIIGALAVTGIRTRARIIRIGAATGLVLFIMILLKGLLAHVEIPLSSFRQLWQSSLIKNALTGFANGLVSGFIFLGILPFMERWFGVLTDLSLLELADLNQPILKKLSLEAPGTYHHSLRVGDLAYAAAEAIGADSMLTRVGAYYHDIGKLTKPEYFTENEIADKHKDLAPTMSALIIIAHVKDGLEIARLERLSRRIQDFVIQHHGTSVVRYFYQSALEKTNGLEEKESRLGGTEPRPGGAESDKPSANGPPPDKESFRYPGPKPQSKEVGIVLLADSVEATSRSLTNINPGKLKNMVHEIIINHLLDGQLDQSRLTMWDLKKIEEVFIRVLAGMFHARIQYPETT